MNTDTTSLFIASLVKTLQSLCHGYVDFEKNIEIIGHIYLNVDKQHKIDYIVNERICKKQCASDSTYISNSFHAHPTKETQSVNYHDAPLDLQVTFQQEYEQGRTVSHESSMSESGVTSVEPNQPSPLHFSKRKRQFRSKDCKQSPNASPSSRMQDFDHRNSHDSPPLSRTQYPLGASASKLARRISNELDKQGHGLELEIHKRLTETSVEKSAASPCRPPHVPDAVVNDAKSLQERSIDLTCVKEEVLDDAAEDEMLEQFDWSASSQTMEPVDESDFPRTGPDEADDDGQDVDPDTETGPPLYPVMLHKNASQVQLPGYGSPVFPQSFAEPSTSLSARSSPASSSSVHVVSGSAFTSRRPRPGGQGNNTEVLPRPGKVPLVIAQKHNMVELCVGQSVFVYPAHVAQAKNKVSATACANYLLSCFYTTSQLLGSNLTGVNNKRLLDPQIITCLLEFTLAHFPRAEVAMLKKALRNKITAAECRTKKKFMSLRTNNDSFLTISSP